MFVITDISRVAQAFTTLGGGIQAFIDFQYGDSPPRILGGLPDGAFIQGVTDTYNHQLFSPFQDTLTLTKIRMIVNSNNNDSHY